MLLRLIILGVVLGGGFVWACVASAAGAGYPGKDGHRDESGAYRGYNTGGFFYFGGPRYYGSGYSSRYGSPSGPGSAGRGPGLGK